MAHLINWVEIPVIDYERAKKFYTAVFGISIQEAEMEGLEGYTYGIFEHGTSEVSGALVKGEGYVPSDIGCLIYFNADFGMEEILQAIEKNGGKIKVPKTLITEDIGYFAFFYDPEGNKLALHSSK